MILNNSNMDVKLKHADYSSERTSSQGMLHRRTLKRFLLAFLISSSFCSLFLLRLPWIFSIPYIWPINDGLPAQHAPLTSPSLPHTTSNNLTKVPLEAHIMSKCPDARDCLRDFVVPAMEKIVDMVDFRLSFIGRYVLSLNLSLPSAC